MARCLVRRAAFLPLTLLAVLLLGGNAHADTLTVTSTADSGGGSLRETVAAADPNDTVFLPASAEPYRVTSNEILITDKPLTIQGAGAASSVIDGENGSRRFRTSGSTALTVRGLTLTRGALTAAGPSQGGGAIHHAGSGTLTVLDCTFAANHFTAFNGSNNGGAAIRHSGSNLLTISGSTFRDNSFSLSTGVSNSGGGAVFHNGGTLSIETSSFTGNNATVSGSNGNNGGGAVFHNGGTLSIESSSLTANALTLIGPVTSNTGGGAVFYNGGDLDISDSSVSGNSATITASSSTNGGGGFFHNGGDATITRSALDRNTLTLNGGTINSGGGGLFNNGGSPLTISRSSLSGNSSDTGDTTGSSGGGGLYDNSNVDPTTITNSTLSDNTASPVGAGSGSGGGAIRRNGGTAPDLVSSTVAGNATDGLGGGVLNNGTGFSIKNTILAGNTAGTGANCSAGTVTAEGKNIDDGTSCGLGGSIISSTNPLLGPLGAHGGLGSSQMLLAGSPALGAGVDCPQFDQRGVARPQAGGCDIGAVEVEPALVTTADATDLTPTSAGLGASVDPRFSATDVRFEYGTTSAYGSTSGSQATAALGTPEPVSIPVDGLKPNTLYHFRALGSNATGVTVAGEDRTFTTPKIPRVTKFGVVPDVFSVAGSRTPKSAARRRIPRGSSFRYRLDQAAIVRIQIYRLRPGRKAKLRGTFTRRKAKKGRNRNKFSGRIGRKALKAGHYRAKIAARAAGSPRFSRARSDRFRIVKARKPPK